MPDDKQIILSVSQLNAQVRRVLESSIPRLWVKGEVSNMTAHSSGHLYFSLKDSGGQVRCVMFKTAAQSLLLLPQDGMQCLALADVTLYERAGQYQLNVQQLQIAGQGELALAFERLKNKLFQEGLFDPEHKRPIPKYPTAIGLVTSPTGAVLRDIIKVVKRRWPLCQLILNPVPVQGVGAGDKIAQAIEQFNRFGQVQFLIVGRGGGSAEDLWAFNDEAVARAIYNSKIPVISAVGHEVDFTIADFTADLRAPTPSAAAELAVPDLAEVRSGLSDSGSRMKNALLWLASQYEQRLKAVGRSYGMMRLADLMEQKSQQLDRTQKQLGAVLAWQVGLLKTRLDGLSQSLAALGPGSVLARGYSICRDQKGMVIKDSKTLKPEDSLTAEFARGWAKTKVKETGR
ncbi:exodeoxyribonuclease VII large subunit [candidate division TA06 bacterium]|nr:exodeoxyribonuclease VII large subunit [candidate division TA06 bacterium]